MFLLETPLEVTVKKPLLLMQSPVEILLGLTFQSTFLLEFRAGKRPNRLGSKLVLLVETPVETFGYFKVAL